MQDNFMNRMVFKFSFAIATLILTAVTGNHAAFAKSPETSLQDFLKSQGLSIGSRQDDATNHYSLRPVLDVYEFGCSISFVIEKFENGFRVSELKLGTNSVVQLGDSKQTILVRDSKGTDYLIRVGSDKSASKVATKLNQHKEKCKNGDEIFD